MDSEQSTSGEVESVVQSVRRGDRKALESLLAAHRSYLKQVVGLRMDDSLRVRVDPSDLVQEAYLEAEAIRQILPALEIMGAVPDHEPSSGSAVDVGDDRESLGDFHIIREIGRGGMGVVYEARQISLGRTVALKVLPFAAMLDQRQLKRFQNEARAAASLKHPNIVSVYSVGCERAVHFYAMEYIEGQTLAQVIHEFRRLEGLEDDDAPQADPEALNLADSLASGRLAASLPPTVDAHGPESPSVPPSGETARGAQAAISTERSTKSPAYFRSIAQFGIQVAEALDHAHEEGVIHRDIKPSNLILDAHGKVSVTDFGLARIEADPGLTMTGDFLGTLRYMSPEQALGKRTVVNHGTDIYSLGVSLYELLTLRPAYPGRDRAELLRRIAFEEPKPPRKLNRVIPAELETIVLKAMAKDPAERYATAGELADDLNRFLDNKPIRARRTSLPGRFTRWGKRNPMAATVLALLLLFAVAGPLVAVNQTYLAARARAAAIRERQARRQIRRHL